MIKQEILEQLLCFTDEEINHLNGISTIDTSIYGQKECIDYHHILEEGQLLSVRKHARFAAYPEHSHNYIEMSYVYAGSMTHVIDDKEITIKEGELILLNRDVHHRILNTDENDIIFNFIINPEFFAYLSSFSHHNAVFDFILNALYNKQEKGEFMVFRSGKNMKIRDLVEDIITNIYEQTIASEIKLKMLVGLLLVELLSHPEEMESYESGGYERILCTSMLSYIANHYDKASLQEIASQLHEPDYFLSKVMKSLTGETFKGHLTRVRLDKATDLLSHTNMPIFEIMQTIGYENLTHFYKLFKAHYHMTPKEYRDQCLHKALMQKRIVN